MKVKYHNEFPGGRAGKKLIIFSDLDGTLLDSNYQFESAKSQLNTLRMRRIPLVLVSSKTAAEMIRFREDLSLETPLIVENGAAIVWPDEDVILEISNLERSQIVDRLELIKRTGEYSFEGFNDWSIDQIVRRTGLDSEGAAMANMRKYSEPIIWLDSLGRLLSFQQQLKLCGLRAVQGGRFLTIMGDCDKANAMDALIKKWKVGNDYWTVALGDSPNDIDMLNNADVAVQIRSPHSCDMDIKGQKITLRSDCTGPDGWAEAVDYILSLFE